MPSKSKRASTKEYEVDEIRAILHCSSPLSTKCLIKWTSYDELTTEPIEHIVSQSLIDSFKACNNLWTWKYYLDAPIDGMPVGWHPYSGAAQALLSQAFATYCQDTAIHPSQVYVHSGKDTYTVNFLEWTQVSSKTLKRRSICCLPDHPPVFSSPSPSPSSSL